MNREVPVEFLDSLNPQALPVACGHNWRDVAFQPRHHKTQALEREFTGRSKKVAVPGTQRGVNALAAASFSVDEIKSSSAHQLIHSLRAAEEGRSDTLSKKTFATLEDKVLRFFAYFTEQVRESALEAVRHRRVTITYFPADDSFLVQEPHFPNSGLQGGVLLKRQPVKANARQREELPQYEHLCLSHIRIGEPLVINELRYHVYGCDAATRAFLEEMGLSVPADQEPPEDSYYRRLRQLEDTAASANFGVKAQDRTLDDIVRTQRFIQDSGKVLRFYCVYDDSTDTGRVCTLELQMFVEDDTVCVVERQSTGEAVPSKFLSRRRLPKDGKMDKTVELTFAHRVNGMRETDLGSPDAYYGPRDLDIGKIVNVFGRNVRITDCDDFTRAYYRNLLGIELAAPVQPHESSPARRTARAERPVLPLPPYTGFGTFEDSLSSCKSLCLKPPKGNPIDPHSRMEVLRFQMRLHNPERLEDRGRLFTLNYFVEDGEMMVTETALRNSGFTGGKFNRKQRLIKSFDGTTPVFYTLQDIAIGAVLNISNFLFEVVACDLHTSNFLAHPETRGVAPEDAQRVTKERLLELLTALRSYLTVRFVTQTEAFRAFDRDRDGCISLGELLAGLKASLITHREEEAVAVLQQVSRGEVITHNEFFQWLAAPLEIRTGDGPVDTTKTISPLREATRATEEATLRATVLRSLKERLEARCLNVFEMFRMASTMPRAFKGRRADIKSLTNTDKDATVSPVQLHRCVEEVLGLGYKPEELRALLEFFFPGQGTSQTAKLTLQDFQAKFVEMSAVNQLPAEAPVHSS